jgi:uncharacterized protein YqjF (DUF2071 family)
MTKTFLQAEWRKLAMANYSVDISRLKQYLPFKTEPDLWNGICYVSLIGFLFKNTKVKGFRIPFHINFEEVNLRFYVRHYDNGGWKRGVVFIKEIVPKPALTFVANTIYKEKYETMPMSHSWTTSNDMLTAEYKWKKKRWNSLTINADKIPRPIAIGSEEEFITEHYWGYTKITDSKTSEYGVEHPRWEVYPMKNYLIDVDFEDIYGHDFSFLKTETPKSVFLAEGSLIKVKDGRAI